MSMNVRQEIALQRSKINFFLYFNIKNLFIKEVDFSFKKSCISMQLTVFIEEIYLIIEVLHRNASDRNSIFCYFIYNNQSLNSKD